MEGIQQTSTQLLENEKSDLQTTVDTLVDLKHEIDNKWARECFDVVIMAVKDKQGVDQ